MSKDNLDKFKDNPNYEFWQNLKQGWDLFEHTARPPNVEVKDKRYYFEGAIERELCFQQIKAAYDNDVTWFRIDDRKCLEYLPSYVESVRSGR